MTGPTDIAPEPTVLIDEWQDGCIDETAWVEVKQTTPDAESAVGVIEVLYPLDDRCNDDEEHYVCTGEREFLAPTAETLASMDPWPPEGPWEQVEPDSGRVQMREFWVVRVVCKV